MGPCEVTGILTVRQKGLTQTEGQKAIPPGRQRVGSDMATGQADAGSPQKLKEARVRFSSRTSGGSTALLTS